MPFPFWIKDLGKRGEYLARRHYHRRGFHLVERNWRHGKGEIDLIMAHHRLLVFVEVKTRTYRADQRPGDTLGHEQERRLQALARAYVSRWREVEIPWGFHLIVIRIGGGRLFSLHRATIR